jgi:Alpha/beta hydrolase of unknown function (DUF1400)
VRCSLPQLSLLKCSPAWIMPCLGVIAGVLFTSEPGVAANKIVLKYGPIEQTLLVKELQTFVETGKPSGVIAELLDLVGQEPENVQKVLTDKVSISVVSMDRLVNSYFGDVILQQVGQIITPIAGDDVIRPLRAGFVNGIKDGEITILSFIQSYPTDMAVDGKRYLDIQKRVKKDGKNLPEILAGLQGIVSRIFPGLTLGPGSPAGSEAPQPAATPDPLPSERVPLPSERVPSNQSPPLTPTPQVEPVPQAEPQAEPTRIPLSPNRS